jgi:hypothetical protein
MLKNTYANELNFFSQSEAKELSGTDNNNYEE